MNRPHFPATAHWHAHLPRHATPLALREWLINRQSLTQRLVARCETFRVQCLHQRTAICLADEYTALNLPRPLNVTERDVLLHCDAHAMVYAHTVLPLSATAQQWPLFASLGNRSLGSTLFQDPLVTRCAMQYAQLQSTHPLVRRIQQLELTAPTTPPLYARRSVFTRQGSSLLVTEVFLPTLSELFHRAPQKGSP